MRKNVEKEQEMRIIEEGEGKKNGRRSKRRRLKNITREGEGERDRDRQTKKQTHS